jgi:hypothetical protein
LVEGEVANELVVAHSEVLELLLREVLVLLHGSVVQHDVGTLDGAGSGVLAGMSEGGGGRGGHAGWRPGGAVVEESVDRCVYEGPEAGEARRQKEEREGGEASLSIASSVGDAKNTAFEACN